MITQDALILAPMAGVADRAMRTLCRAHGAAFCVGELTSAKGVVYGDEKSRALLDVYADESPMGIQLFGDDPALLAEAARRALNIRDGCVKPAFVDINMGCPAPKVAKSGGGVSLMGNVAQAARLVRAVADAVDIPVSAKMRTGLDAAHLNAPELARAVEASGAAFVTVHGRTRQQMYAPPVDMASIAAVVKAVNIPVIGNGDVHNAASAAAMRENTGCAAVMIGRAACGAPWVFSRKGETPSLPARMALLRQHAELLIAHKGANLGILHTRKHAACYLRGLHGAAAMRAECMKLACLDDLDALIKKVLDENAQS